MSEGTTNGKAPEVDTSRLPAKNHDWRTAARHFDDEDFAQCFPNLYDLLSIARRDGQWRAGSTLMLFAEGGALKACINDRDTQQTWFLTLASSHRVLEAVEEALQNGGGEWRRARRKS